MGHTNYEFPVHATRNVQTQLKSAVPRVNYCVCCEVCVCIMLAEFIGIKAPFLYYSKKVSYITSQNILCYSVYA